MTMMIEVITISLIAFSLRVLPRLIRPNAVATDTYYHLGAAEEIRRNSFRMPERLKEYLMDSPYDYPPLFHYILALFEKNKRERVEKYISAFIDTLYVIAVYFFAQHFFKQMFTVANYNTYSLVTTLLVLSVPTFLGINAGPRAYQATPRVLGEFFAGLALMAGFLFYFDGSLLWGVVAVLASSAALLASKFSAQVILFFSLILALFLKSIFFLALPVVAFITAVILSGGYYIKVIKGHLGHLYIFKRVTMKKYLNVRHKNRLIDVLTLPRDILYDYKKAFNTLSLNNTFMIVAIRNPQLVLLIPIYIELLPRFIIKEPRYFLAVWIIASLICFLVTSLKPFQFLGEGDRYLEYSVLPQILLFTAFVLPSTNKWLFVYGLLGYHFFFYALNVVIFAKIYKKNSNLDSDKEEVFGFLRNSAENFNMLPIGMVYELAYKTGAGILFPSGNFAINYISEKDYDELYEVYSIPSRDISKLLRKYNLNSVFVNKKAIANVEKNHAFSYDFSSFAKIFENNGFVIYSITERGCEPK